MVTVFFLPVVVVGCVFPCGKLLDLGLQRLILREFFYAVSYSAAMNLHIKVLSGLNSHHICEAMFKSFAKSLDMATGFDPRLSSVLSTKGSL